MPEFYIYAKGRWRTLDVESGFIDGWREKARFVYAKNGRLNLTSTTNVLRGLRALVLGHSTSVERGPQIPYYKCKREGTRRRRRRVRAPGEGVGGAMEGGHCCVHALARCGCGVSVAARGCEVLPPPPPAPPPPPPASPTRSADRVAPPGNTASNKRRREDTSSDTSAGTGHVAAAPDHPSPAKKKTLTKTKDSDRSLKYAKDVAKRQMTCSESVAPQRVNAARENSTESSGGSGREELYKELIIHPKDVSLIRRYLKSDPSFVGNFDAKLFDRDESYRSSVFYKVNPLVMVERSGRVSALARDAARALKDFAIKLGLRHVTDLALRRRRYTTRKSIRDVEAPADSDDADKENRLRPGRDARQAARNKLTKDMKALAELNTKRKEVGNIVRGNRSSGPSGARASASESGDGTPNTDSGDAAHVHKRARAGSSPPRLRPRPSVASASADASPKKRVTFSKVDGSDGSDRSGSVRRQVPPSATSADLNVAKNPLSPIIKQTKADPEIKKPEKANAVQRPTNQKKETAIKSSLPIRKLTLRRPVFKRSSVPAGREYSALEDHAIVAWVCGGDGRERRVNGNRLWRDLQRDYHRITGQSRSWHSLRNRYLRYILPALPDLALPPEQVSRMRAAAARGEIKSKRKATSDRAPLPPVGAWQRRPRPPLPQDTPSPAPQPPAARALRSGSAPSPSPAATVPPPARTRRLYTARADT